MQVTLDESWHGELAIPSVLFRQIVGGLPRCIRRAEDDAPDATQFGRLPLAHTIGDRSFLRTRNTALISQLLSDAGVSVQINSSFQYEAHENPIDFSTALLALTKEARDDVGDLSHDDWERLAYHRYAQLVAANERQKFSLAALLCAAFPEAPAIVFVVASNANVERVARELSVRLQTAVHCAYGGAASADNRIVVANFEAAQSEGLRDAPFYILPDWRPGLPQWMKSVIWRAYADRIYLLRTEAEQISAVDEDGLFGRLGPVIISPKRPPAPVHTFSIFPFGGHVADRRVCHGDQHGDRRDRHVGDDSGVELKRKHYWRHRRRNQALAGLAESLAGDGGPVTVFVETLEHAQHLAPLLPRWPLIRETNIPDEMPANTMVTQTAADICENFRPGRLVWAAGGPPSEWLAGWLREMTAVGQPVQIYDLSDGYSSEAKELADARHRRYGDNAIHWRPLSASIRNHVRKSLRHAARQEKRRRTANKQPR